MYIKKETHKFTKDTVKGATRQEPWLVSFCCSLLKPFLLFLYFLQPIFPIFFLCNRPRISLSTWKSLCLPASFLLKSIWKLLEQTATPPSRPNLYPLSLSNCCEILSIVDNLAHFRLIGKRSNLLQQSLQIFHSSLK